MRNPLPLLILLAPMGLLGCTGQDEPIAQPPISSNPPGTPVSAEPQRAGDPALGYSALVNNGYVSCGIPYSAYSTVFGPAAEELRLPNRNMINAELPYSQTRFT